MALQLPFTLKALLFFISAPLFTDAFRDDAARDLCGRARPDQAPERAQVRKRRMPRLWFNMRVIALKMTHHAGRHARAKNCLRRLCT
eukprot:5079470-Pleurochrysis_carterae.AAC.1